MPQIKTSNPFPTRVKYTQQPAVMVVQRFAIIVFLNIFLQGRLFRVAFLFVITFVTKIANKLSESQLAKLSTRDSSPVIISVLPWPRHHFGKVLSKT